jgi:hypothetical protein
MFNCVSLQTRSLPLQINIATTGCNSAGLVSMVRRTHQPQLNATLASNREGAGESINKLSLIEKDAAFS